MQSCKIAVTKHARIRLEERGIYMDDIIMVIKNGEIIKEGSGKMILKPERSIDGMLCMECGANAKKGYTTDVTDLGSCLVIVRNVPCYKCTECNETIYTADVIKRLDEIVEQAKKLMQEIAIIDYEKIA